MSDLLPYERTWDALYGMEIEEPSDSIVRGRVPSVEALLEPSGSVSGGIYASIAESLASRGTGAGVWHEDLLAMGMSNTTHVVRRVSQGELRALARVRARAPGEWLWDVEVSDSQGELCAVSTVLIAVRPSRATAR